MSPLVRSARTGEPSHAPSRFVLYLEGPRDGDILRAWARRTSPWLEEAVVETMVILGGRQPHRAADHFRDMRSGAAPSRGLCVLDRDHATELEELPTEPPELEFFTWSRRHIESYLLVPSAMKRTLRDANDHFRLERALRDHLPDPDDEQAMSRIDAKRLLGRDGAVSRALGRPIPAGRIARNMHQGEFHPDIRELLDRIKGATRSET